MTRVKLYFYFSKKIFKIVVQHAANGSRFSPQPPTKRSFLGSIVIEQGNDRGSTNITIAELTGHFSDTNSRNVAHVRSRFEIQEIDQIVLRLNRVEGNFRTFPILLA